MRTIIIFIVVLLAITFYQISALSHLSFSLKSLTHQSEKLFREIKDLTVSSALENSLTSLPDYLKEKGFQKPKEVKFIRYVETTVSAR